MKYFFRLSNDNYSIYAEDTSDDQFEAILNDIFYKGILASVVIVINFLFLCCV